MTDFKPLKEHELDALTDERLLAHLSAARNAGDHEQVRVALQILVFGHLERVKTWVAMKIPIHDIEDVTATVIASAVHSAANAGFEGTHVGEFRAWLRTIAKRRIADYFRSREGKPAPAPLPDEHDGEDGHYGSRDGHPDHAEEVAYRDLIVRALGRLSEAHQLVIQLSGSVDAGFDGLPAKEAAAKVNDQLGLENDDLMTDANVHKILSRFRATCQRLDDEEQGDG